MIIYTANFGNYDKLTSVPYDSVKNIKTNCWNICYTDDTSCVNGTDWSAYRTERYGCDNFNAKKAKWVGWQNFHRRRNQNYLYIDANCEIVGDLAELDDYLTQSKIVLHTRKHINRHNIWEEFQACVAQKKGQVNQLTDYVNREYMHIGAQEPSPVYENGIIAFSGAALCGNYKKYREFTDKIAHRLRVCGRDQLILPALAEDNDIEIGTFNAIVNKVIRIRKTHG